MKILKSLGDSPDERTLNEAVTLLRDGFIIIYPTDTIYALGCDALNQKAIERLCRIKNLNPDKNLLSIVCPDISEAAKYARIDNRAFKMLKEYLPGPFTFVLPAATQLPKVFKGRKSVGVRIPDNAFARALAQELGGPILTSSVNPALDGNASDADMCDPEALAMHYDYVKDIALTVDGGEGSMIGSTVVDCLDSNSPTIIRQGVGEFID